MKPRSLLRSTSQSLTVLFVISLLLSGCTTGRGMIDPIEARERRESAQRKDGPHQPGLNEGGRDLLTPTLNSITNRIQAAEQKLAEWREVKQKLSSEPLPREQADRIYECTLQLEDILSGYRSLHNRLLQETRFDAAQLLAGESLLQLNQQDVGYLEGGCGRSLADLRTMATTHEKAAVEADSAIREAYANQEYERVITLYGRLPLGPGQFPAHETVFQYGQSLVKNHQEAAALTVLDQLLQRMRQQKQNDLELQVLRSIADLQFGLGSYEQARVSYEELNRLLTERGRVEEQVGHHLTALQPGVLKTEELRDYSILLRNHLAFLPKRDNFALVEQADVFLRTYPGSAMTTSVESIRKSSRDQADAWLNRGIQRIEALANERKPIEGEGGKSVQPSQEPQINATPPSGPPPIASEQKPIGATQTNETEQKVLEEDFEKGMALLTAKDYEKSIEQFAKLLQTSFADKARAQIDEAAKLAAQQDREKAAALFVRATNARDPESKKNLLLSSRQLLQAILVKYPQSGLADKVQRNLANVERELSVVEAGIKKTSEAGADKEATTTPAPSAVPLSSEPGTYR